MKKTALFLSSLFILSMCSCGSGVNEKEKEVKQNDSIAKIEKQRIIDSVKQAENNKNQETKSQPTTSQQKSIRQNNQGQEEKNNLHIDKSGAIRLGQPKN
jgi:hypothetical protein